MLNNNQSINVCFVEKKKIFCYTFRETNHLNSRTQTNRLQRRHVLNARTYLIIFKKNKKTNKLKWCLWKIIRTDVLLPREPVHISFKLWKFHVTYIHLSSDHISQLRWNGAIVSQDIMLSYTAWCDTIINISTMSKV